MSDELQTSALSDNGPPVSSEGGVFLALAGRLVYPAEDRVLQFLREGWFEYRELTAISRIVRPGDSFIDVGAHCGLYACVASRRMNGKGTIVAVEPNSDLHSFIRRNLTIGRVVSADPIETGTVNLVSSAVNARSGEAEFHVGQHGWTAYSTLGTGEKSYLPRSITVTVRPLESLIPAPVPGQQIWVKLDTEGFEFDILEQAASFLASRDDIHLMIEFDENNLVAVGRGTEDLTDVVKRMGYALAEFDLRTERLVPFQQRGPVWGMNLFATKNVELLNARMTSVEPGIALETGDFLRAGQAAARIYRRSEELDTVLASAKGFAMNVVETTAKLEGRARASDAAIARVATACEKPETALCGAVVDLLSDELARLEGAANSIANDMRVRRDIMEAKISLLNTRLLDQSHIVLSALAKLTYQQDGRLQGALNGRDDLSDIDRSLALVEVVADDVGRLIGVAEWYLEERNSRPSVPADSIEEQGHVRPDGVNQAGDRHESFGDGAESPERLEGTVEVTEDNIENLEDSPETLRDRK